jgi:DNA-binding NarL/FixJ family response regulator
MWPVDYVNMNTGRQWQSGDRKVSKILIVDDHPMIRERLAEVIQKEQDLVVCGEAEDVRQALKAASEQTPDLAIVDLSLRNSHGLDFIKDLRALNPRTLILALSMHDEALLAERVIRAGARGYITKQEATRRIMVAIRTVLAGKLYLTESLALRLASRVTQVSDGSSTMSVEKLTDRELRVFELIGHGQGTRQIAGDMGIHVATVETYRSRIKEKLNLRDANELRQSAIRWTQDRELR